jgi:spondin-2
MTSVLSVIAVTLAVLLVSGLSAAGNPSAKSTRACEGLASYQLILKTLWSKETFESNYPLYRPAAQWSKLVGRSHSQRYSQWSIDKLSSESLKEFSEQGLSNGFDAESQGSSGIYDAFIGPNITAGVGTSHVKFLAHPNYHKLSFVVRMIPSPDWFIGVDSVDLCTDAGQWESDLTLDLHPMDAGTDRGLTFTSPNWPERPQKPITTITSKSPDHPAGSFYYPEMESLPPIAKVQLTKVEFDWMDTAVESTDQVLVVHTPLAVSSQSSEVEKTKRDVIIDKDSSSSSSSTNKNVRQRIAGGKRQTRNGRTHISRNRVVPEIVAVAEGQPVDCEVSAWTDWSACSKTCGFGQRVRSRTVIRAPTSGGQPCPLVREEQLCGSMRNCGWKYFSRTNRTLS